MLDAERKISLGGLPGSWKTAFLNDPCINQELRRQEYTVPQPLQQPEYDPSRKEMENKMWYFPHYGLISS